MQLRRNLDEQKVEIRTRQPFQQPRRRSFLGHGFDKHMAKVAPKLTHQRGHGFG